MTRVNELDYSAMSVAEIFGEAYSYTVPSYQRGYAWTDENVDQLLDDVLESFEETPGDSYILGQTILCPRGPSGGLEIVDGQQRMTTIYLLIALGWLRLNAANEVAPFAQARQIQFHQIAGKIFQSDNAGKVQPRMLVSRDGQTYVGRILEGVSLGPESSDESLTQRNIRVAKGRIEAFFDKEFQDADQLFAYVWHVLHKVLFFTLTLSTPAQALGVFAKMNNRGLTLDDADLLKNLLFQHTSDAEYSKLSNQWDDASKELFKGRLKRVQSMQFLLKALIGIRTGDSIPTTKVFKRWEGVLTKAPEVDEKDTAAQENFARTETVKFANSLSARAKSLQLLSNGKTPHGAESPTTFGTYFFKWVQHLEVLLAGDHLQADSYSHLSRIVEDRVILAIFAGEKNQKFEAMVHDWSKSVSELHSLSSREEILAASAPALVDLTELLEDAKTASRRLTYSVQTQREKQRYLLARVARILEVRSGEAPEQKSLRDFMQAPIKNQGQGGFHIDHVFPQAEGKMHNWPEPEKYADIQTLGNLVLLHGGDNNAQSDALPTDQVKIDNFAGSLVINRILCADQALAAMPARVRQVIDAERTLCPVGLAHWDSAAIETRFNYYWSVFSDSLQKSLEA